MNHAPTGVATIVDALRIRDLLGLVDDICHRRGVTRDELCGAVRTRAICRARQEAWWRIRHLPGHDYSYQEIGKLFGRDHTTILHGVHAYALLSAAEPTQAAP